MIFNVVDGRTGTSFQSNDCQTLLAAMEISGTSVINVGCRGGGCGCCKIRIINGQYLTKKMSRKHITEEDESKHYTLACRTIACSDLTFISVGGVLTGNDCSF